MSNQEGQTDIGSILIVGTGIAGLTAARALVDSGFDTVVLEARDRAGGRILTDTSLAVPLDLGAAWIHGKSHNPIFAFSRRHGIIMMPTDYTNSCLIDENGMRPGLAQILFALRANRILPRLKRLARQLDHDISVEDAVQLIATETRMSRQELRFLNRHLIEFEAYNGVPLKEQSLFALIDDSLKLHGGDVAFPHGLSQVVSLLVEGLTINYETAVHTITQESNRVIVETNKSTHEADAAIITLPIGVLKSGRVKFNPTLPQRKLDAIASIGLGSFNKIAMRFKEVFWPVDCDMIELIPDKRTVVLQLLNWYKYTGEPILIACVAAETARAWEEMSDEQIKIMMLNIVQTLFKTEVPNLIAIRITRWGQDEFSLGAYSAINPGHDPKQFEILAEPFGRLFFAGEACIRASYGTVHGAHLSGIQAVQSLRQFLK